MIVSSKIFIFNPAHKSAKGAATPQQNRYKVVNSTHPLSRLSELFNKMTLAELQDTNQITVSNGNYLDARVYDVKAVVPSMNISPGAGSQYVEIFLAETKNRSIPK